MSNEERILEMLSEMQGDMKEIKNRLGSLEDKVDDLKEYAEETREGVNKVAEWADNAGFLLKIPFGKAGA